MTPRARAEIQALLGRLRDGDRSAVEPSFSALWPIVRQFSARVLANPTDGEDAAQAALLKVFERVATFDPSRDAVAWVLTIAAFECRTIRRRAQRRNEAALDGTKLVAGETPEALVVERDLEAAVREVIGTLREEDAKAILAAIAGERRVADATFRKRLERALGRLRVAWRAKHGIE